MSNLDTNATSFVAMDEAGQKSNQNLRDARFYAMGRLDQALEAGLGGGDDVYGGVARLIRVADSSQANRFARWHQARAYWHHLTGSTTLHPLHDEWQTWLAEQA